MAFFNVWCPDNKGNRGDYLVSRDEICASLNNVISGTNRLVKELNYSHGYHLPRIKDIADPDDMVKGIHNLQATAKEVIGQLRKLADEVRKDLDPQTFEKYLQCNELLSDNLEAVCRSTKPLLSFGSISFQETEKIFTKYRISTIWAFLELAFALLCGYAVFRLTWRILTRGSDVSFVSSVGIIASCCSILVTLLLFIYLDHTCQPSRILREVPGFSLKFSKPPGFTQSTVGRLPSPGI